MKKSHTSSESFKSRIIQVWVESGKGLKRLIALEHSIKNKKNPTAGQCMLLAYALPKWFNYLRCTVGDLDMDIVMHYLMI